MNNQFDPTDLGQEAAARPQPAGDEDTVIMSRSPGRRDPSAWVMLKSMFDMLPQGAVVVDMRGKFLQFNDAGVAILGMGATSGPSENWPREYGLFLPDAKTPFPHESLPLIRALRGERVENVQMFARNPNLAAGKWLRVAATPIYDEHGHQSGAVALFSDESERKNAEQALDSERRFLRHLITTQDRDRRLTAYDLHDGVVQMMTGALMRLEALAAKQAESIRRDEDLVAAVSLIRDALDEARRLIGGMRPPILDDSGLIGAVHYLVDHHRQVDGLRVEFVHDVKFQRLSALQESTLFRIVQESLHNAARHSGTDRVRVDMQQLGETVRVEVRDWGCGFDIRKTRLRQYGLRGIEERANLLGGNAEIDSLPGQGTTICVTLPLINALKDEIAATDL